MQPIVFFPAASIDEAVARIFALTGAAPSGTRGEKRAVVALRDALGLDVDLARTNVVMGRAVAESLDVAWHPSFENRNRLTLTGLNALLRGATAAYERREFTRLVGGLPEGLDGAEWVDFVPARSKIEAVNRISNLTGSGPEWLGPGSKEHKSVLVNLARGLAPHLDVGLSKTKLGAALAGAFNAPWGPTCESTGETISLAGLNVLLAGAERRLGRLGKDRSLMLGTPEQEASALVAALADGWRAKIQPDGGKRVVWDGRQCIRWMLDQGVSSGPYQNVWLGFYWESRGRVLLNEAFTPNPEPRKLNYGGVPFDYSLNYVWDMKAHTRTWRNPMSGKLKAGQVHAPLNDGEAMDSCIADQGLGFLIVSGMAIEDSDGAFLDWHRALKTANHVTTKPSNSGRSRRRKAAFEPLRILAVFFPSSDAFDIAKVSGQIQGFPQGKQAPRRAGEFGLPRRPKYKLHVARAVEGKYLAADYTFPCVDAN